MPTYELLKTVRNDQYDAEFWKRVEVLYKGSKTLKDLLASPSAERDSIFPRHMGEEDWVYQERCQRACYIPYMTQLVDYILSVLFSDPLRMSAGGDSEDLKPGSVDPFYQKFEKNTARPGARAVTLNQLLRKLSLDALLYKSAWCLVDFPQIPLGDDGQPLRPTNRLEEERLGVDRAYCVALDPECVLDWETNEEDGQLDWVLCYCASTPRLSVEDKRDTTTETYTVYDRQGWTRYSWTYKTSQPPKAKSQPQKIESGKHSFGRVPVVQFELPEGLWAGGKLENIAVELFNKRSALSWGQYRSLFQVLQVSLQSPDPLNPVSEDAERAVNQPMGPGRVLVLAGEDKAQWLSPDSGPFKEAREDMRELREEMHRVLHQMAQAGDTSNGQIRRSGESKRADHVAGAVVSRELGRHVRDFAVDLYTLVSAGRNEKDKEWVAIGMDEFDDITLDDFVQEASVIESINIPSPTFQIQYKYELASKLMPGLTDEQKEQILDELEDGLTAEQLASDTMRDVGVEGAQQALDNPAPTQPGESVDG